MLETSSTRTCCYANTMFQLPKLMLPLMHTYITTLDLHLQTPLLHAMAGVSQIHTTIDGIGERTGIPALAEVAVGLTYLFKSANDFRLDMLQDLSRLIEDYTGIARV